MAVSVMPYAGCVRASDTRGRQGKANFYSPEEQRQGILEGAGREGVEVVFVEPDAALAPAALAADPVTLRQVWDQSDTATRRDLFLLLELDAEFVHSGGKGMPSWSSDLAPGCRGPSRTGPGHHQDRPRGPAASQRASRGGLPAG